MRHTYTLYIHVYQPPYSKDFLALAWRRSFCFTHVWWYVCLPLSIETHFDGNYGLIIASKRMANWNVAVYENLPFFSRQLLDHNCCQNANQYLYLHLFTTIFAAIFCSIIGKRPFSQISNVKKVRNIEQPPDEWRTEQSRHVI